MQPGALQVALLLLVHGYVLLPLPRVVGNEFGSSRPNPCPARPKPWPSLNSQPLCTGPSTTGGSDENASDDMVVVEMYVERPYIEGGQRLREKSATQVKSSRTPNRGHQARSQSRKEVGCMLFSSRKVLLGLSVRGRYAYRHFSLVLCYEDCLSPAPLMKRCEAWRIEVQYMVSFSGRSVSNPHSPFSLACRKLLCHATRGRALRPPFRCWTHEDMEG